MEATGNRRVTNSANFVHASASDLAASVLAVLAFRWGIAVMAKTVSGLFNPFSLPVRCA